MSLCLFSDRNIDKNLRSLPASSIKLVVESLLDLLPEESAPAVIVVKQERPASRIPNGKVDAERSTYDPGMMYLLELATILTLRDQGTLEATGERLLASLQAFVRDAKNIHSLALSRIIYYLLNLLRLSHVSSRMISKGTHLTNMTAGTTFHASASYPPRYLWV